MDGTDGGHGPALLVVEDDHLVRKLIARSLIADGFDVVALADPHEALRVLATRHFQLALLDIRLPSMDGLELCRRIIDGYDLPVIFVTAKDDMADVVRGLEAGAVDYIKKPFEIHELRARVNERLNRATEPHSRYVFDLTDVTIDTATGEVSKRGGLVHLTMTEFRLLVELARQRGTTVSREMLLQNVWASSNTTDTRLVDMAITRLRKKIEDDPAHPRLIKTVRGGGYTVE